ncbi:MAG TPA: prolyl oligopeptidase family serine peptidase [Thermoanaerobaculia bacterium]|nr:prolyl oligopeptidase family serine peptidase [Thermoanaerobaculia bacterium]
MATEPRRLVCLAALWLTLVLPAAGGAFTLEAVLAAPFPSALVAADAAPRIAWVLEAEGVRNVWTAAAPDFAPRRLTGYQEDDGQALGGLALTADGSLLVYVRGGDPNRAGDSPNPASAPLRPEQAVWAVSTAGGEPWKLGAGSHPVISPRGDRVLFSREGKVFVAPLAPPAEGAGEGEKEAEPGEPRELFAARGGLGSLAWSPDGSRVAFASDRGDHGFVGVYDSATERITWLAPSVDRDMAPAWSADGDGVAFLRLPGRRQGELLDLTGANPFAVWVADPASGEGREVWRSPADAGGFAQYYPAQPLLWAAGDRLLFWSEHDGWMRIWSLPAGGGAPAGLTPGGCEAEDAGLDPSRAILYFSSNCGDVDRRHLWRVAATGGEPRQLTRGDGIETTPTPLPGGGWLALRHADARLPQAVAVAALGAPGAGEPRRIAPASPPPQFPLDELVVPEQVVFEAADGVRVHGQLFVPRSAPPAGGRPAVIFMHGGPIRQMLLGWHSRGYYSNAYAMNQYLASRGTLVLSVNFRSGIGYGQAFRRAAEQGPRGASEYRDIRAAGLWLRGRRDVAPDRIGLWGGSYGGYLTALGLARDSDLFAAGVDFHGVHDWSFRARDFMPGGAWGITEELMEQAFQSSPLAHLTYWTSPILLIHGDDDRNVLFQQSTDLVQRLREKGVPVEVLVFPDEVHGFLRHQSWLRAFHVAAEFFDRWLGKPREGAAGSPLKPRGRARRPAPATPPSLGGGRALLPLFGRLDGGRGGHRLRAGLGHHAAAVAAVEHHRQRLGEAHVPQVPGGGGRLLGVEPLPVDVLAVAAVLLGARRQGQVPQALRGDVVEEVGPLRRLDVVAGR